MKLILNDGVEIEIASMNDNYNSDNVADSDKRSISFTISDPDESMTIDYLADILTNENVSKMSVTTDKMVKQINACQVVNINENISDDSHFLTIRMNYIKK